jgi:hypothetical protein
VREFFRELAREALFARKADSESIVINSSAKQQHTGRMRRVLVAQQICHCL